MGRSHGRTRAEWERDFWDFVDKSGECWLWTGRRDKDGYGWAGGTLAHRLLSATLMGPIPHGICVLHRCDNPSCVTPDHLWRGTTAQNVADRDAKGRGVARERNGLHRWHASGASRGAGNPEASLTLARAHAIRTAIEAGTESRKELAVRFGTTEYLIGAIAKGQHWSVRGQPDVFSLIRKPPGFRKGTHHWRWHSQKPPA